MISAEDWNYSFGNFARHVQSESSAMANVGETVVKYVGHKISKVRWIPQVQGQLNPSETFVTGGWDDKASSTLVKHDRSFDDLTVNACG